MKDIRSSGEKIETVLQDNRSASSASSFGTIGSIYRHSDISSSSSSSSSSGSTDTDNGDLDASDSDRELSEETEAKVNAALNKPTPK